MSDLRGSWLGYLVAPVAVGVVLALRIWLAPPSPPYLLFFGAVMVSAWAGGFGPGLLATALALLGVQLALLPPSWALAVPAGGVLVSHALFAGECVLISALCAALRRSTEQIRRSLAEVKSRERALQESKVHKAAIFESALDCVLVLDPEGRIVETNPASEAVLGWPESELVGRSAAETIVPERFRAAHRAGLKRYLETRESKVIGRRIELQALRKDGTEIPVELAIAASGSLFVGYLRDITERKKLYAEREGLLREAHRANAAKDTFLSLLGHELRNPLSAVRNALSTMRRDGSDPERDDRLFEIARRQIGHVGLLVDDLFEVARAEAGKLRLTSRRLDLGKLVEQSIGAVRATSPEMDFAFEKPSQAIYVDGDRTRLRQVLDNLYSNARKVSASGEQVRVEVVAEGKDAVVRVCDTGSGIAPELLERIFEPYVQGAAGGGLGLGLPLARLLIEAQGGSLVGESEGAGRGAQFTIRLPLQDPPSSEALDAPKKAAGLAGLRVLVIDDHHDSADSMAMLLERSGCLVEVAYTGETGLAAAARKRPDSVICDLGLPDTDGCAVAQRLRQLPGFDEVQLVALTGYAERGMEAEAAGFDSFLSKPVNPVRLRRLLRGSRSASDAPR